jgi:hypothetical protein
MTSAVRLLIERGADLHDCAFDEQGPTPLDCAVRGLQNNPAKDGDYPGTVAALVTAGAPTRSAPRIGDDTVDALPAEHAPRQGNSSILRSEYELNPGWFDAHTTTHLCPGQPAPGVTLASKVETQTDTTSAGGMPSPSPRVTRPGIMTAYTPVRIVPNSAESPALTIRRATCCGSSTCT